MVLPLLDLDYQEDVRAEVDMNVVMTGRGKFVEVQGSGEEATFDKTQLLAMIALGRARHRGTLAGLQKAAIEMLELSFKNQSPRVAAAWASRCVYAINQLKAVKFRRRRRLFADCTCDAKLKVDTSPIPVNDGEDVILT